jgi:hypothetical protein
MIINAIREPYNACTVVNFCRVFAGDPESQDRTGRQPHTDDSSDRRDLLIDVPELHRTRAR